ncbi:MAG TPA: glycosyltransferase family 1 protein [Roseiflexaceae bacterium]|nr:glycosyltransferase family 1 protein [Roseiflexaceae bacterium]
MHIGIDISRIAVSARTGTEHYTYELLAAIARRDRERRYTLYCNRPPAALPPLGPNFALRRIPLARLWTHVRLSAEVLRRPPDVLFVPAHVLPLGAPLARRTRSVVTIHDMGYLHFPAAHTRAQRLYLRLSTAWSARAAHRVIAVSAATRADLVRLAGVRPEKIAVVHHGLAERFRRRMTADRGLTTDDHGSTTGDRRRVREIVGSEAPYFLYVGTIQPRKNLVRLIEAFAAAFNVQPSPHNVRLVIAGKTGWLAQGIAQRAAELGVADRVRFAGYVPDEDVPDLMTGALAFVFPSLYEGFGMPVLEAMSCGAPVLTSTTSSLPEVAGDAALLVDPEDTPAIAAALTRLAAEPELRAELRRRGYARAAQFTWERCAEQTLAVLLTDF